jgi:APA family basic amino acid/polyamine antiporter
MMMKKEKDLSFFKRFVMPIIALAGCFFMIIAACFSHKIAVVAYLIIFAIIMLIGAMFSHKKAVE